MRKARLWFLVVVLMITVSCQPGKTNSNLKQFAVDYTTACTTFKNKKANAKSEDQRIKLKNTHDAQLQKMLEKYNKLIPRDDHSGQLLKCNLLISLSKYDEATRIISGLIKSKSNLAAQAQLTMVRILIKQKKTSAALSLFRSNETRFKKDEELYSVWLHFSLYANSAAVRDRYAQKFLAVSTLPPDLGAYNSHVLLSGVSDAMMAGQYEKSETLLKQALKARGSRLIKPALTAMTALVQLPGNPAMDVSADVWHNTPSPILIKGKATVLAFHAPWSEASRKLTPLLNEAFQQYKNNGLMIINYFRLYGNYRDGKINKSVVGKAEEFQLLKDYIKKEKILHPVAISAEGYSYDTYKVAVVPTVFFIDKTGTIRDVSIGAAYPERIKEKIRKLLEDK